MAGYSNNRGSLICEKCSVFITVIAIHTGCTGLSKQPYCGGYIKFNYNAHDINLSCISTIKCIKFVM